MINNEVLGVDRSVAFSDTELSILTGINVKAIGFYLGGPYYSINGWKPEDLQRVLNSGFGVMPIYVGQNFVKGSVPPILTAEQGGIDGTNAVQLINLFFNDKRVSGSIALDMERSTWEYNSNGATEYAKAWVDTVKKAGFKAGIYSSLDIFDRMIREGEPPSFMWIANWVSKGIDSYVSLDRIPGVPTTIFTDNQRCWQYSGNTPIHGLENGVDINLFDSELLMYKEVAVINNVPIPTVVDTETAQQEIQDNVDIEKAIAFMESAISILKGIN